MPISSLFLKAEIVMTITNIIDPDNCFEGITITLVQLSPNPGKVKLHKDVPNDPVYSYSSVAIDQNNA
jgi:hypothetical protein